MTDIRELIRQDVKRDLRHIPDWLRHWLEDHIITPRLIKLSTNPEGTETREFWVVTDEVGHEDSSYRIVYDPDTNQYGLEMTLNTGIEWYMGPYGTFAKAAEAL